MYLNHDEINIRIGTETLSIEDLFIEIDEQDLEDLPNKLRIYYGYAWLNKSKEFHFKFRNTLTSGKLNINPRVFISSEAVKKTSWQKFEKNALESLTESTKPNKLVFIASKSPPRFAKGRFINFNCPDLHHIDYRLSEKS